MSTTGPRLTWLGVEDILLAKLQQLHIITKGRYFGDADRAPGKNNGRVKQTGVKFDNIHIIISTVIWCDDA